MTGCAIVTTTVAGAEAAKALAHALVEARLAACVQILPITSIYRWNGGVEESEEAMLVCKITAADFDAVATAIKALHGYDVPEIVMTSLDAGDPPYLAWIAAETRRA